MPEILLDEFMLPDAAPLPDALSEPERVVLLGEVELKLPDVFWLVEPLAEVGEFVLLVELPNWLLWVDVEGVIEEDADELLDGDIVEDAPDPVEDCEEELDVCAFRLSAAARSAVVPQVINFMGDFIIGCI